MAIRKAIVFRLIAISISLTAALLVVELVLRLASWPVPGLYTEGARERWPVERTGREGGRNPPGVWRLRSWEFDVEYGINEHGFRERPLVPKKTGEHRIGVLGDSTAAGHGVELDERFERIWANELCRRFARVSVWNLSTALVGTAHSAEILEGVGREYALDEIVLVFFAGNDLFDNREWYEPSEPRRTRTLENLRVGIRDRSRLAGLLWVAFGRSFLGANAQARGVFDPTEVSSLWVWTEESLQKLLEAARGRPLTIWYLPSRTETDAELWAEVRGASNLLDEDRWSVRHRVESWAKEHDVLFLNLTHALEGRDEEEVYFPIDGHLNAKGHMVVAKELSNAMSATAIGRRDMDAGEAGGVRRH